MSGTIDIEVTNVASVMVRFPDGTRQPLAQGMRVPSGAVIEYTVIAPDTRITYGPVKKKADDEEWG